MPLAARRPVFDVYPLGSVKEDARDVLLYFYYGGLVFIGLKRLTEALESLKMVRPNACARGGGGR